MKEFNEACKEFESNLEYFQQLMEKDIMIPEINRKNENKMTVLHQLCTQNIPLEILKWLIESNKADPQIYDDQGKNALHITCQNKANLGMIDYLTEKCEINVKDSLGNSYLHLAIENEQNEQVIELLIQKKIDLNSQNYIPFETPLHILIKKNIYEKKVLKVKKKKILSIFF